MALVVLKNDFILKILNCLQIVMVPFFKKKKRWTYFALV
jgi:hypothetical protein